jgi:alpha-N-acetylglucosamine transferase
MPEKTALCTVSSAGFIPGTNVLFHSFQKYNPWFKGDFIVITDDQDILFPITKDFRNVIIRKPAEALLARIESLCHEIPALTPRKNRFFSLEAFNLSGYDRVIFMDSDIVVVGDFSEALNGHGPLAACSDMPVRNPRMVRDRITFRRTGPEKLAEGRSALRKTFNAGMMILRPGRMQENILDSLLELVTPGIFANIRTHNTDQVVLNLFFDGRADILPSIFNMIVHKWPQYKAYLQLSEDDLRALHFTGSPKPWETHAFPSDADMDPVLVNLYKQWQNH